jgi:uncharacterized protein (TIGR04255 family)
MIRSAAPLWTVGGRGMHWEPARADHSIDRVVATINFPNPIDANSFDEVVVAARKAAAVHSLTDRFDVIEPITLPAGQNVINLGVESIQGAPPRRIIFRRMEPNTNMAVDQFSVSMQRITLETSRYRRWVDFFEMLKGTVGDIAASYPTILSVRSVRLEYVDRFNSTTSDADQWEVINKTSDYLSPAVRDKNNALHVHSGWFDFETPQVRRLTNINIDITDVEIPPPPEPIRKIAVLSLAQVEALEGGVLDNPLERIDAHHGYLKSIFGKIITPEAAARVALND